MNSSESNEPRIDRRFWFGGTAIVDTGRERLPLRNIRILQDGADTVTIQVAFLNQQAITRQVTETSRTEVSLWIHATEGSLYLSGAHDSDFSAFTDIDIPAPPDAIPALVREMEEAIQEWEADEDGAPAEPIFWDSEGGAQGEIDAVIAYASAGHFVEDDPIADVCYIVNQTKPIYGARWQSGKWAPIPANEALDSEAEFVTIARGNERRFLDLLSDHAKVPYALAILASIPPNDGLQISNFTAGMNKWLGFSYRRDPQSDDIFQRFLEGRAEIAAGDIFDSAIAAWKTRA